MFVSMDAKLTRCYDGRDQRRCGVVFKSIYDMYAQNSSRNRIKKCQQQVSSVSLCHDQEANSKPA